MSQEANITTIVARLLDSTREEARRDGVNPEKLEAFLAEHTPLLVRVAGVLVAARAGDWSDVNDKNLNVATKSALDFLLVIEDPQAIACRDAAQRLGEAMWAEKSTTNTEEVDA